MAAEKKVPLDYKSLTKDNTTLGVLERLKSVTPEELEGVDSDGDTLFHNAVHSGSFMIIPMLKQAGASNMSNPNNMGLTPFDLAVGSHKSKCSTQLIMIGHDVKTSRTSLQTFHMAAAMGCLTSMRLMVSQGFNVTERNSRGETVAHILSRNGRKEALEWILNREPELAMAANQKRNLPMHLAAKRGHEGCIEVLHSFAPKSVNALNIDQRFPISLALMSGHLDVFSGLQKKMAPSAMLVPDVKGVTPFMLWHDASKKVAQLMLKKLTKTSRYEARSSITPEENKPEEKKPDGSESGPSMADVFPSMINPSLFCGLNEVTHVLQQALDREIQRASENVTTDDQN